MKDFRNLKVWEKSHGLALEIYRATDEFPKHELYGVTSQLRRATTSIPTNIVEGCGKTTDANFSRFVEIAFSSAIEVEYLLLLATELGYLKENLSKQLNSELIDVKRMLAALIKKLKADR